MMGSLTVCSWLSCYPFKTIVFTCDSSILLKTRPLLYWQVGKTLSPRRWNVAFSEDGHLDIAGVLRRIQRGVNWIFVCISCLKYMKFHSFMYGHTFMLWVITPKQSKLSSSYIRIFERQIHSDAVPLRNIVLHCSFGNLSRILCVSCFIWGIRKNLLWGIPCIVHSWSYYALLFVVSIFRSLKVSRFNWKKLLSVLIFGTIHILLLPFVHLRIMGYIWNMAFDWRYMCSGWSVIFMVKKLEVFQFITVHCIKQLYLSPKISISSVTSLQLNGPWNCLIGCIVQSAKKLLTLLNEFLL